jgi:hypothetical protein
LLHRLEQVIGTSLRFLEDRHLPHRRALGVAQALAPLFPLFARPAACLPAACIVWRASPADSMLDIRLQASPQQPKHQSVSCPCGGVHIRGVRLHRAQPGIPTLRKPEAAPILPE